MKNIVAIGGGHGLSTILQGIRNIDDISISAIVTVADDGGSTGRLRKRYTIPAMGDIRNVLVALSDSEPLLHELMNYRFEGEDNMDIAGHSLGNLILTALTNMTGSFNESIRIASDLLKVKGRSDLYLRLVFIKKAFSLCVILLTMNINVLAMCAGSVLTAYACLYINTYYTGKLIQVSLWTQLKDLFPSLIYSLTMGGIVFLSTVFIENIYLQLFIGIAIGITYYFTISTFFKSSELAYVKLLLKENLLPKMRGK